MSAYRDEFANASKTAQRKIAETEGTAFQFQNEFAKTFEEMSRAVFLRVRAEIELGVNLTQRLGAARSLPDVVSAYQEWLRRDECAIRRRPSVHDQQSEVHYR